MIEVQERADKQDLEVNIIEEPQKRKDLRVGEPVISQNVDH